MLPARIPLDGRGWRLKGFLGDSWQWELERDPGRAGSPGWLPATVPGSVLHDLWQAGEVPDPYVERNSLACEWVP
jgi:beta-mannosidase